MAFRRNEIKWIWDDKSTAPYPDWYEPIINMKDITDSEIEEIKKELKNSKLEIKTAPITDSTHTAPAPSKNAMGVEPIEYKTTWTTTATTTDEPVEIKAPEWKVGDKITINSPIDIGVVGEPKGWVCPRCGRVNAPWVSQCSCSGSIFKKIDTWSPSGIPEACRNCSNHPSNGGSGICLCTLGTTTKITC